MLCERKSSGSPVSSWRVNSFNWFQQTLVVFLNVNSISQPLSLCFLHLRESKFKENLPLLITTLWFAHAHKYYDSSVTWRQRVSWQGRSVSNQTPADYLLWSINHLTFHSLLDGVWNSHKPQWSHSRRDVDGGARETWSAPDWKLAILSCTKHNCLNRQSVSKERGGLWQKFLSWFKLNYSLPFALSPIC